MNRREAIRKLAIGGAGVAVACSESALDITGPSVGAISPDAPTVPSEPEFNAGPMVNMGDIHGFSAFALAVHDTQTQRMVWRQARRRGYTMGRVCAETQSWPGGLLPKGRMLGGGALQDFRKMLEVAADEDMQVMVVAVATLKEDGTGMPRIRDWCESVGKTCRDYQNVIIEAVNEYSHPRSSISREEVRELIRILRRHSDKLIGTDQNLGFPSGNYGYDKALGSDFPSFHPWRTVHNKPADPTRPEIEEIARQNSGQVIFSETVALGSQADVDRWGDLVTTDKRRIERYGANCRDAGVGFFFHSIEGLTADGFSWMPEVVA